MDYDYLGYILQYCDNVSHGSCKFIRFSLAVLCNDLIDPKAALKKVVTKVIDVVAFAWDLKNYKKCLLCVKNSPLSSVFM